MLFKKTVQLLFKSETLQTRNASQVAFIGLGQMGAKMAKNLIQNGNKLKVYDVVPAAAKGVQNAQACNSLDEVVEGSEIIITMLPNGKIVKDTLLGNNGILTKVPKDAVVLDCSTIEPQTAIELHEAAKEKNIKFLDAPVSGGVTGAEAGTLTFMIGGEEKILQVVQPALLHMGKNVYHCGKAGSGQIAKICNNLILGITMIGTCEAFNLGVKLGLDAKKLTQIVNVSTGRSWSSEIYNPVPGILPNVPASNGYQGGFSIPLISKDLGIAESSAVSCNAPVPLTAAAHQLYRAMLNNGYKDKDFSAVYEFLKGKE